MSSFNDYVACSNNSINDNVVNAKKARSTSHQLKQLLKPIFALLKKNKKNTYRKSPQPEYFNDESEIDQNAANELLEARILEEIDNCDYDAALPVYRNGTMNIVPVFRGQKYIPVHFAKTEAGTFFWTSMIGPDNDISTHGDKNAFTQHQLPTLQVPCDRWAQA